MITTIGRIKVLPFVITILAPKLAPKMLPAIITKPTFQRICPPNKKSAKEARFEVKFITFACAVAFGRLNPSKVTQAKLMIEPVPGPKKPS